MILFNRILLSESDIRRKRTKMQVPQKQTYTLCHVFKEKQEFIWGFDDDSEVEDGSCQSEMLSQASIRMPTSQEKSSLTNIASDLPSCSQQACSHAEEIDWQRSSSYAEREEGSNGYSNSTVERRKYSPDGDPSVNSVYDDEDRESSSEEEDYAFDASCDTQEGSLPNYVTLQENIKCACRGVIQIRLQ